ncbi:hypothetical protein QVD17_29552 [Tagetes erecta]|uniref:Uncharacterized protein n=1 Tax=Tagetes erecta TaxID=13708 RepID=A0AAD8K3Q4_TARER|nr:hypothetical protein QVD17_29552 [Tagetes erecta]
MMLFRFNRGFVYIVQSICLHSWIFNLIYIYTDSQTIYKAHTRLKLHHSFIFKFLQIKHEKGCYPICKPVHIKTAFRSKLCCKFDCVSGFLMLNLYIIAIASANNRTSWVVISKDNDINVLRSLSPRVSTFNHKFVLSINCALLLHFAFKYRLKYNGLCTILMLENCMLSLQYIKSYFSLFR